MHGHSGTILSDVEAKYRMVVEAMNVLQKSIEDAKVQSAASSATVRERRFITPSELQIKFGLDADKDTRTYFVVTRGVEPGIYRHNHEAQDKTYRVKDNSGAPGYLGFPTALARYTEAYNTPKGLAYRDRPNGQFPEGSSASPFIPSVTELFEKYHPGCQERVHPPDCWYVLTSGTRPGIYTSALIATAYKNDHPAGISYKVKTFELAMQAYQHALDNGYVHAI